MLYDILNHIIINQTFLILECIHKNGMAEYYGYFYTTCPK